MTTPVSPVPFNLLSTIADRMLAEADRIEHLQAKAWQALNEGEGDRPMALMDRLQKLNLTTLNFEDAIELATQADALRTGYKRHQVSSPEWLDDGIRTLDRYIGERTRDQQDMELRELRQAEAADKTVPERRTERAARIAELEKSLGKVPTTA